MLRIGLEDTTNNRLAKRRRRVRAAHYRRVEREREFARTVGLAIVLGLVMCALGMLEGM